MVDQFRRRKRFKPAPLARQGGTNVRTSRTTTHLWGERTMFRHLAPLATLLLFASAAALAAPSTQPPRRRRALSVG